MYNQLKKSPHDGTGVLDSTAISMVSQAIRLGKGNSIMMQNKCTDGDQREFDYKTKVITNERKRDLWDVSQLCTKQVDTGEMIK